MEQRKQEFSIPRIAMLLLSGILIGGGAILPGISGGVLCVVFGIYQPMMEILSHPLRGLPRHWRMFLPVGLGWLIGFFGFARVIEWIFGADETLGTWLFIGLIAGTMPQLFREAGEKGRGRSSYLAAAAAFAALFGLLLFVRLGAIPKVAPSCGWYIFCGVLWGLSLVVPGMSSSAILIPLGLFEPLNSAIANFNLPVIGLWILGLAGSVVVLARLVNSLFEKHYAIMYHIVLGVTIASTIIIVPLEYASWRAGLLSALCFAVGLAAAYGLSKLDTGTRD